MQHELTLLLGPVQNQILPFVWLFYSRYSRYSASIPQAYQENAFDIAVDTLPSLVSISAVRECVTTTLQTPPSSRDALTCVTGEFNLKISATSEEN